MNKISYITAHTAPLIQDFSTPNENIALLFWNGKRNLHIYFQDIHKHETHTERSIEQLIEIAKTNFPITIYAQTPQAFVKIEIARDLVHIYPLEPYCLKQGIDASEPQLDLDTYIKITLGLCENIAIYSLETKS